MNAARQVAIHNLRVDHVTADVLRSFAAADVASILIKGRSTARWLHREQPRQYQDCDVLVGPEAIETAERALREQGFAPAIEWREMPAWWRGHAVEWWHPGRYAAVDLHHGLKGVDVDEQLVWDVLHAETETMTVGGFGARVLTLPGRALVLALDRVGDGVEKHDLDRAIEIADESTWSRAADLARRLGVTTAFATGLRLAVHGPELATRLGLPAAPTIDATLRATRAAPGALTLERLARASGMSDRWSIVRHKLVPPPTFMRQWSYRARTGRRHLVLAYGRRIVWVARATPGALRSWRRALRADQTERPVEH